MTYRHPHHNVIAGILERMRNKEFLIRHGVFFGGGTAISLLHGEYRLSLDIDFLVDAEGAVAVRNKIYTEGFNSFFPDCVDTPNMDRYLIRGYVQDVKVEFLLGSLTPISGKPLEQFFDIPTLDITSFMAQKLMANAGRGMMDPSALCKDIIDLGILAKHDMDSFPQALADAEAACGTTIREGFTSVFMRLLEPERRKHVFEELKMSPEKEKDVFAGLAAIERYLADSDNTREMTAPR